MIKTAFFSDIGERDCNEDSYLIVEKGEWLCVAVADGLGGHGRGDLASAKAIEVIKKCFLEETAMIPKELEKWIKRANLEIMALQTRECRMKTTLVVLCMSSDLAFWAHVGDSRLYYFANAYLSFATKDHSASQLAVDLKEIKAKSLRNHSRRNILLKALGAENEVKAEVSAIYNISKGNTMFLLCSDGFWESVFESDMKKALRTSHNPQEWIDKMILIHQQRRSKKQDNLTAIGVWKYAQKQKRGMFF